MIAKISTATTLGLNTQEIQIELDISPSLPAVVMVGLPDKAVQESKERIRSSLKESGFEFPLGKLTINLAPADLAKTGTGFDLPIALGILKLMGYIEKDLPEKTLFLGELSLEGNLRAVRGVLTICLWAKKNGFEKIFLPKQNQPEAALVKGLQIYALDKLGEVVDHLNGKNVLNPVVPISITDLITSPSDQLLPNDMAYIRGQQTAKRALEIAASGGHNVIFIGAPGSGKTLLARSYPTILPSLSEEEVLEVTQIYSIAGLLGDKNVILQRPFRAPHHSASHIALVGGGSKLRPGEISLAHRGVLFLDEFPEFSRETIEALRQPLEDGFVTIARASGSLVYPARFYLLAAANPTPSGFDLSDPAAADRPQNRLAIARYQAKFSGPIMDRIDLQVTVDRPNQSELSSEALAERSFVIQQRVQTARQIQMDRYKTENILTNAEMTLPLIKKYCQLEPKSQEFLDKAVEKFNLSPRGYMRILKVARTIADLAGSDKIEFTHLAESLQYRGRM
jgi:magnesium chelatase family protein